MIGSSLSHYKILSSLGAGGMGEVWRAEDSSLGREVAIKVLPEAFTEDPERLARFEREARVLAALDHGNIASIYAFESAEGRHFLVMQLAEGETLQERIARGPMPIDQALAIARQVAEGLEAAHEIGIVHRDLKPANVKVTPAGRVKVLDFGLAKALQEDPTDSEAGAALTRSPTLTAQMTGAGVLLGTAAYMSPEQARGQVADKRSDIWAFGIVLMEMLTGRTVYAGETVSDTLAGVLARQPEWDALPESTPRAIRRLLERCLTKDVNLRLRDIGEARIAIDDYLAAPEAEESVDAEAVRLPTPAPRWRRALPWTVAAGATVALVLSVLQLLRVTAPPEEPLHATVLPPEGHDWYLDGVYPGAAMISSDGRQIAFAAIEEGGSQPMIWVRPLDSPVARPLPGTEGGSYPFWSPDGRHLAFYAEGKLKKIAVSGGPPVTLCKAPYGKSGSWSPAGVIIYTPEASDVGLFRVPAAGGDCVPLTELDSEAGDDSHRHARFLPDGQQFLYLARRSTAGSENVLRVESLDGSVDQTLVQTPSNGEYGAGRLLFIREGTLMAQPFDPERLELSGEAVPLVERVLAIPGAALSVFTVSSNGVLVHQTGQAVTNSQLIWIDQEGAELQTVGEPADQTAIALSPDGTQSATVVVDSEDQSDLWIDDLRRGLRTRFTFDPANDLAPVWSPTGDRIAFSSDRGKGIFDLYVKDVGGSGSEEPLHSSESNKFAWSWSSDGRYLLYQEIEAGDSDLWALSLDGDRTPIPLVQTEFRESHPMISPDGRWLAYTSNESGTLQIYVTSFPEGARKWQVSIESGRQPRWLGSGEELFFLSEDDRWLVVAEVAGQADDFGVGAVRRLFEPDLRGDNGRDWDVTADGERLLVNSAMERGEISALNLTVNWPAMIQEAR